MADGEAVTKVGDSRSVSSPSDDCSSPLGESPHKLISDCSDLYDLINFHSSAATQIHPDVDDDDSAEEELKHDDDDAAESPSKTNGPDKIIYLKRNRSISVSSSSSLGTDHDSDSGHFSKTNGHAEPTELIETTTHVSVQENETTHVSVQENEQFLLHISASTEENFHENEVSDVVEGIEEGDEELDEFQNLEAEIEQEVVAKIIDKEEKEEDVQVVSVAEPEAVHDDFNNPLIPSLANECVLTQSESSLLEAEPAVMVNHEEPVVVVNHDERAEEKVDADDNGELAASPDENLLLQQHESSSTARNIPIIIETKYEKEEEEKSSGSSSEDEDDRKEKEEKVDEIIERVNDDVNEAEIISHSENVLPPVIVNVEMSQEQQQRLVVDHNNEPLDYIETDKLDGDESDESMEQIITEDVAMIEHDVKLHVVDSTNNSDSDSDYGGKYGYQKKKKVDQFEKTSTTTSSSSAVVTTVVTKKKTAEMKFEGRTSSPTAPAVALENANVKSYRELELAEMESALTGVNINDLKASFSEQQHRGEDEKKSKDVIDTGVNIRSLRALSYGDLSKLDNSTSHINSNDSSIVISRAKSYSDLTRYEEERQREREVIYTGVSVKSLRSSFYDLFTRGTNQNNYAWCKVDQMNIVTGISIQSLKNCFNSGSKDGDGYKDAAIVTGVSIAHIKSSFNSTESEMRYKEFNETDGVKIDRNKITRNFSQSYLGSVESKEITNVGEEKNLICRICGKQVFLMESIKAEKSVFHKTCFRCNTCSKSLSVDTYCSHEGTLYCRQHFRQLFQPKAKFDEDVIVIPRRRHELIIKENIPAELPPDVVRSADKPDYGLNEIPSLKNVKSRFEEHGENGTDSSPTVVHIKRSESIASKMARFQNKEYENGNGHDMEDSSSSEDEGVERDPDITREVKRKKEMPLETSSIEITTDEEVVFSGMSELKTQWEAGNSPNKEERAREKQEELAKLRSRICHGRGNLKAKYESACEESLKSPGRIENVSVVDGDANTNSLKEKFEKGQVANDLEGERVERLLREKEDDLSVFKEQGTAVDARNIFKQIDANVSKNGGLPPTSNNKVKKSPSSVARDILNESKSNGDVVKSTDKIEDDYYVSFDLTSRFKFFENYKTEQNGTGEKKRFTMTPPREIVKEDTPDRDVTRDPNIVRSCDKDEEVIVTDTARKMLNRFRELESHTDEAPVGPKPLKRITPPREFTKETDSPEPEMARDPNIIRACDKMEDDFLVEAHRAKSLREKFEHWEGESEVDRENRRNLEDERPGADMAKSLTAKFESLRDESIKPVEKPQAKVNRFIDFGDMEHGDLCDICGKRVYTMEKLDVNGHKVHKTCFRCSHCSSILRMDNYTSSEGVLYCTPHFKQLFIARGNYDEGFGREQHKERWNKNSASSTPNQQEYYRDFDDE